MPEQFSFRGPESLEKIVPHQNNSQLKECSPQQLKGILSWVKTEGEKTSIPLPEKRTFEEFADHNRTRQEYLHTAHVLMTSGVIAKDGGEIPAEKLAMIQANLTMLEATDPDRFDEVKQALEYFGVQPLLANLPEHLVDIEHLKKQLSKDSVSVDRTLLIQSIADIKEPIKMLCSASIGAISVWVIAVAMLLTAGELERLAQRRKEHTKQILQNHKDDPISEISDRANDQP